MHVFLLMCGLLVGPIIAASISRLLSPDVVTTQRYTLWLCSEYIGNILVVPFCLLVEEVPRVMRERFAWVTYGILVAINMLYVVLRLLKASDTQLGLYLAFPWLLLMTHLYGAAGTYTGCLITGFISAFTTAMIDTAQRNFYVHGHIFILVVTCVCFIEIFRQRDEALNHVEQIVDERTSQLTHTMTQLTGAEKEASAALDSRTKLMMFLCRELCPPLFQIISVAEEAQKMPVERMKPVLRRIREASLAMSGFIDNVLDYRDMEINTPFLPVIPPIIETGACCGISVSQAASCFIACAQSATPTIRFETHIDHGMETERLGLSEDRFREMIQHLVSHLQAVGMAPDAHQILSVSFIADASEGTVCIQTSHPRSVTTKDDLLDLVTPPPSTSASSSSSFSGSGKNSDSTTHTLSVVRETAQTGGGCLHLKSLANENRVLVCVEVPVVELESDGLGADGEVCEEVPGYLGVVGEIEE
ncbi:hypothetical protein HK102_009790 [Quaeritorhiza haematococci]|nr:hypothetical protein HK102_009790 [Quaeritorhiza haematococci]